MQDLFFLIQSLSPNEKRYVSIYINKFSSTKNNYSILYQHIEKQTEYDEVELVKKLRKEPFVKHIAVTKHYLFELILNAMREYYDEQFLEWKLKKQAAQIFVLSSKGLDKAAHKLLLKTKEEAWQYENYYVLLDIINHEKWLFGNRRIEIKNTQYGIEICEEENKAFFNLKVIQDYKTIWHELTFLELTHINYSVKDFQTKLTECTKHPLLQQKMETSSYLIKTWYHSVWAHYFMLMQDKQQHFEHYREVVKIREQQLTAQPQIPLDLLATYYNFMMACYQNNAWTDLELYLQKIQTIETKSIEKKIKFFHDYYHGALLFYLGTKQYENGYALINEIQIGLKEYKNKIRLDFLIWIWQCCGLICFFNKKYKEANKWWQQIQQLDKTEIELKTQCSVELYSLMLTIEEHNFDVFDYQIKQVQNRINECKLNDNLVLAFLQFCKKIDKNPHLKDEIIKKEKQDLLIMQSQYTSSVFDEFIVTWLISK